MKRKGISIKLYVRRLRILMGDNFILLLSLIIGGVAGINAILLKNAVFFMRKFLLDETGFDLRNYFLLILPAIGITLTIILKKNLYKNLFRKID